MAVRHHVRRKHIFANDMYFYWMLHSPVLAVRGIVVEADLLSDYFEDILVNPRRKVEQTVVAICARSTVSSCRKPQIPPDR